jgi:hypothetical protein
MAEANVRRGINLGDRTLSPYAIGALSCPVAAALGCVSHHKRREGKERKTSRKIGEHTWRILFLRHVSKADSKQDSVLTILRSAVLVEALAETRHVASNLHAV